jgi:ATP-binding cassette, subfamily B, bacterial
MFSFPFYKQRDAMDCGPTCLKMIAYSYGRQYPLTHLRERSYISREGVSARGIMEAAESIGLSAMTVKVPFGTNSNSACLLSAPLPCIAHWNQQHFVVVYKASDRYIWIADPAEGKIKLKRTDFEKSWISDAAKGILILVEPTPTFYSQDEQNLQESAKIGSIFTFMRPYSPLLGQVVLGMILSSLLLLVFPFLTQSIVDYGIDNRNPGFINLILIAQLMLFVSQTVVQFLQNKILLFVGARVNVSMVNDFLSKLMKLPIGFFDTKMTGDLMQRIGDQARIEAFLTHNALSLVFSGLNFIVFSAILLLYNPVIFSVFAIAAIIFICWITLFLKRRKELDYVRFQQAGENSSALIEMIQGMQEIKLQGSERKRRWLWANIQARLFHTSLRNLNLIQWQEAGAGCINQSKNIIITFLAANAVINGQMTLGMMLATQYIISQLDAPLQQFIGFIRSAQDAKISLERLGEIQNQQEEDQVLKPSATAIANHPVSAGIQLKTDITLNNLSFRYNALQEDVLKDISLTIPRGKVTAIVGTSGSGKTTLIKLLLGFYQPTKGALLTGNTPLSLIPPSEWRKKCGAVLQDGFVFSDTIANNISECDEQPDVEKLLHAVKISNIWQFIQELPLGFNTRVGAQGNGISQGQKQRLLIARAIYKNPEYLFFDEATNALDANNERTIVENLQSYYTNQTETDTVAGTKTVVVVAHRLSTVRHADQIVVLEKGQLVETGTHDELTKKRGIYFQLVKNQLELGS